MRIRWPARAPGPMMLLTLTLTIAACAPGEPVTIRTDSPKPPGTGELCYLSFAEGELVTDAAAGTAIIEATLRREVIWPAGYTGRRAGSEIEVLDRSGHVVVRTGTRVHLPGGYSDGGWLTCTSYVRTLP